MVVDGQYDGRENYSVYDYSAKGEGIASYEACYFCFNRGISREDAIKEIEQAGWFPAKIEHLLLFGATYPEEQRQLEIIALGALDYQGDGLVTLYAYRESFLIFSAHESYPCSRAIGYRNIRYGLSPDPKNRFLAVRPVAG